METHGSKGLNCYPRNLGLTLTSARCYRLLPSTSSDTPYVPSNRTVRPTNINTTEAFPSQPCPKTPQPHTQTPFALLRSVLASLCPASHHIPPILLLTLSQFHCLHQVPHARLLTQFSVLISRAVVIRRRAVNPTVMFSQPDQTDDEGGPVLDGDRR